jgi:hypothetical protein
MKNLASAKSTAKKWVRNFMLGDVAELMSLSDVPFAFDKKEIIKDTTTLRKKFAPIEGKKRNAELTKIEVVSGGVDPVLKDLPAETITVHIIIEGIRERGIRESILVYVKPGAAPTVVGFSD